MTFSLSGHGGEAVYMEKKKTKSCITDTQVEQIRAMAETIGYGSITLVFQDGVLVQIDRNEKIRVTKT